nr:MAG TPA: hypothetical protein [Caudoviricetes sp.]
MKKNKHRWKDLPVYDRLAKKCKQHGGSDEMCENVREKVKKIMESRNE